MNSTIDNYGGFVNDNGEMNYTAMGGYGLFIVSDSK